MAAISGHLPRSSRRAWLQFGLLATPVAVFAVAAWAHRNVIEDGFIYLRIVHQVTEGHGPVFNVGERVEAFTSPLWLGVLSVADLATPVRLEWLAVLLGITATLAGLVLAVLGSSRLARLYAPNALLVPFGVLVTVVLAPMWFYASSGLETGITFLWLGASLWILAGWATSSKRLRRRHAVVLGLGWLVRPEMLLFSAAFLAVVFALQWTRDTWRYRLKLLVAASLLPAAYQLFRMGYYGSLVANTAIAKEGTHFRWERGWRYFRDFVDPYWLFVPVLVMLAGGWAPVVALLRRAEQQRGVWVVSAFLAVGAVSAMYVIAVGGDYEHARLLLPALFAVCAPVAVVPAIRGHVAGLALIVWVIAAIAALRPPDFRLGETFALPQSGAVTTDQLGWGPDGYRRHAVDGSDLIVQTRFGGFEPSTVPLATSVPRPAAALEAVGVVPYALGTDLYVLDRLGLADPFTARLEIPLYTELIPYPGHEKVLPKPWIAARLVASDAAVRAADLPGGGLFSLIKPVGGQAFQEQIESAREVMRCPDIRRLQQSATAPITPRRFLRNILDSFSNTQLRIPPDPEAAYRTFCSDTAPKAAGALPHGHARAADSTPPEYQGPVALRKWGAERLSTSDPSAPRPHVIAVAGFV